MITAEQARENKENATKTRIKRETDVWTLIEQASLAEKDYVSVEFDLDKETLKQLKAAGFKVYAKMDNDRGCIFQSGYTIKW